jgi:hypothetical protein
MNRYPKNTLYTIQLTYTTLAKFLEEDRVSTLLALNPDNYTAFQVREGRRSDAGTLYDIILYLPFQGSEVVGQTRLFALHHKKFPKL